MKGSKVWGEMEMQKKSPGIVIPKEDGGGKVYLETTRSSFTVTNIFFHF